MLCAIASQSPDGSSTSARIFARNAGVAIPLARAFARHGRKTDAASVLDTAVLHATDRETLAELNQVRVEVLGSEGSAGGAR